MIAVVACILTILYLSPHPFIAVQSPVSPSMEVGTNTVILTPIHSRVVHDMDDNNNNMFKFEHISVHTS